MSLPQPLTTRDYAVVVVPAEVDLSNATDVLESLLEAITRDSAHLVVDARDVRFLDSSGLNVLIRARERAESAGGSLHVVAASRRMRRLLEMTSLTRVLRRVDSVERATACITNPTGKHVCAEVPTLT